MSVWALRFPAATLVLAAVLVACGGGGGGGGGSSVIPVAPGTTSQQTVSVSGAISTVQSATSFVMQTTNGASVTVSVTPSTVVDGPAPFEGENVDVAGTQQGSAAILAASVKQSNTPLAAPSGTVAVSGTDTGSTSTGFTLRTDAGAVLEVTTDKSTTYANGKPANGSYLEVSGPGSETSGVTARLVALFSSTPPAVSISGTIKQQTPYGIQVLPASGSPIDVAIVTATAVAPNLTIGSSVTISGAGSSAVAVFAASLSPAGATTTSGSTATPAPTAAPSSTAAPTPTAAPTATPASTATPAPTATPVPTASPTTPPTLSPTPTPVLTASPTPAPPFTISTQHVQTGTYLWSSTEAATSPAVYAPYLTWAYPVYSNMLSTYEAGIHTIVYVDPQMPQSSSYEYTDLSGTYSSVRATDCSGNVITTYSGKGLLADPRSAQTSAYYNDVVNWYIQNKLTPYTPVHDWDAMFVDNNGALYGASATPCNYTPSSWGQAFDTAIATVGQQFISNSLATSDSQTQTFVNYLAAPNVIGGEFEECFSNGEWTAEEDSQLETVALLKSEGKPAGPGWWCYLDNTSADGATVIPGRLFAYASFLLTYDPNYSLFQESFTTTPSTFQVFPETGFVPTNPASTPVNISGLKTSSGAYVQYYSACYYRGSLVGPCEIAVNPSSSTVSVPNPQSYSHSMVISGDGVLDGGSVTFSGAAASSLGANLAEILVP